MYYILDSIYWWCSIAFESYARNFMGIKHRIVFKNDFKAHADKEQQDLDESMKEAFRQRDERKAREQGQIRPFTEEEKKILREGLQNAEVKED